MPDRLDGASEVRCRDTRATSFCTYQHAAGDVRRGPRGGLQLSQEIASRATRWDWGNSELRRTLRLPTASAPRDRGEGLKHKIAMACESRLHPTPESASLLRRADYSSKRPCQRSFAERSNISRSSGWAMLINEAARSFNDLP